MLAPAHFVCGSPRLFVFQDGKQKGLFGKRSASGRRRSPCGQLAAGMWACGQPSRVVHMSTCRGQLSIRQCLKDARSRGVGGVRASGTHCALRSRVVCNRIILMAQKPHQNTPKMSTNNPSPVVITGITSKPISGLLGSEPVRSRVQLELSPPVLLCLDHICEVTGSTRTQLVNAALMEALPGLLERADTVAKRSRELVQVQASKKR